MYKTLLPLAILIALMHSGCKKDKVQFAKTQQLDSHTTAARLNKILFVNDTLGFVMGGERFADALMLTTIDGGYTWTPSHYPIAGKGIYDATISPLGGVYTVGFDGKLLYSTDTGKNWRFTQMDYDAFTGISFTGQYQAITVTGISFNEGKIVYIDTFGTITRRTSYSYQLNGIKMVDATTGYIWGFGALLMTTDGGNEWVLQNVDGDNFSSLCTYNNDVWMCGTAGSILHSKVGSTNWERLRNGNDIILPKYRLNCIYFKDDKTGWACGENGKLIKTDDGGHHWQECERFTTQTLRSITLAPNGDLLVCGDYGALYRLVL